MISTNGIRLHVVQSGPRDHPLVILLHGFPEFSRSWRQQIPALVSAGYRVWAPDQRGYNLSDKPDGIAAYGLDILAEDVVGLIDAAGEQKAYLVGHDWGASVAWHVAAVYPDRLKKLVILNVPHMKVMKKHLRSDLAQLRRSWYIFLFQIPWLAEKVLSLNNWERALRNMKKSARPGTFSRADLEAYRQAWLQPKAYTSMINWYRALVRKPPDRLSSPRISVPTLMIWGVLDKYLGLEMAQESIDLCDDGRLELIAEATHWVQHEEPERVNHLIETFFKGQDG